MKHFKTWRNLPPGARGTVTTIGNFDGVHLGHQAVLKAARDIAAVAELPIGVLTFEPHPRQFFTPDIGPFRLMNASAKAHRLEKIGLDYLFEIGFDRELATLEARAFSKDILADGLGASHIVVGENFRFGKGRSGDVEVLKTFGEAFGFEVHYIAMQKHATREVSSTLIRDALSAGKPREAVLMLGHWHRINGQVVHSHKRGRKLGFPTANIELEGLHLPRFGVYAAVVDIMSGAHKGHYRAVASLGIRPMFGENKPNLEAYIFDFAAEIYGEEISIGLVDFLRPEQVFPDIEGLKAQMEADCQAAMTILQALK